jgi:hypothetical protein
LKKTEPVKRRVLSVKVSDAKVNLNWRAASITVIEYVAYKQTKEVTILLSGPRDVSYIREQLDKVVADWHRELQNYAPTSGADGA